MSDERKHGYVRCTCWLCFTHLTTTIPHSFTRDFTYDQYQSRFFIFILSWKCQHSSCSRKSRVIIPSCDSWVSSNLNQLQCIHSLSVYMYWNDNFPFKVCSLEKNNHSYSCERMKMQILCNLVSLFAIPILSLAHLSFHDWFLSNFLSSLISFEHKSSLKRHNWNDVMRRLTDYR